MKNKTRTKKVQGEGVMSNQLVTGTDQIDELLEYGSKEWELTQVG